MDITQNDNSFLTFRVGPYHLAVPAVDAEAIITMPEIRSVPLTPDSVSGVFSHRGKITVVISLKRKFGLKESDNRSAGQLIISQISTGLTGFKVDEVLDIIPAAELNFSTLPEIGMITAFDRFAAKNDDIILRTDFELLFRLEDSEELADSLKSLTSALKPESDSDKPVPDENITVSENNSQTTLEDKAEQESTIHSAGHDSSYTDGNPLDIGTEKISEQRPGTVDKKVLLKPGNRSVRKAIPYKARTTVRKTPAGNRSPSNRQTVDKPPKRYLRFAVAGIAILAIMSFSMIWLWPGSDKDEKVAYRSEETAKNNSREVFTRPLDLPQHLLANDTSGRLTDTNDVPEDKNDKIVKTEEPDDTQQISSETETQISEAVEKNNTDDEIIKKVGEHSDTDRKLTETETKTSQIVEKDNTDFTTQQKSEEVLRIETDDFTMTVERPQSQKKEPTPQHEQQSVVKDEDPRILKTDKQQLLKTEQPQPKKTDERVSSPVAAGKMVIIHIVIKGDTLWDIAAKYLGDPFRYPELAKLSRINDPDLIYPGDLIRITKKKQPVMAKQKGSSTAL